MNIALIQTFLAKLYTNEDFLMLFKQAPNISFDLMRLSEKEKLFFLSVDVSRIEKVYSVVKEKQLRMIQNSYPIFSTLFEHVFTPFSESFLKLNKNYSSSYQDRLRQCTDFHDFCIQSLSLKNDISPPFLMDLIRFEYLHYTIAGRKIPQIYEWVALYSGKTIGPKTRIIVHEYVHVEDFQFPILDIMRQLENDTSKSFHCTHKKTHLLFVPTNSPYPKLLVLSSEFRRLLPYFNGEHEFEVLGSTIKKRESPEVFEQLPQALAFFKSNQILELL